MKKNKIPAIILIVLVVLLSIVLLTNNKNEFRNDENNFAISDTTNITKFFISDKQNNYINAVKLESGKWILNDSVQSDNDMINSILSTFLNIAVKTPVSHSERNTIVKIMASASIKTEIYQKVYRINLFNFIKLFPKEKLTRTYYIGGATMSNTGSFALMEGSENPYIIGIPGMKGYITTRYTTNLDEWRMRNIYNFILPEIKSVKVTYPQAIDESFTVVNNDNKTLQLYDFKDTPINDFDTLMVMQFLGKFKDINCESFYKPKSAHDVDSITSLTPYFTIELIDKANKSHNLTAWKRKAAPGAEDLDGNPVEFDIDRMIAKSDSFSDLIIIQYFVFGSIIQPIDLFLKTN